MAESGSTSAKHASRGKRCTWGQGSWAGDAAAVHHGEELLADVDAEQKGDVVARGGDPLAAAGLRRTPPHNFFTDPGGGAHSSYDLVVTYG